ncbi:hypothetical protein GCL60_01220 [Silvanigrella paludirubra]|uniref:Lysoplasmalogenase n=1 Tax=Silvanigrella paludirubra TaxID=2499159 RepID=A0A6N6W070_9BACT|nr:lysoplasmalogenase [Silvanigrella paludirubra]KAB8040568.1 hypothetical protein GCL60_01220 [Silvanigrella paludirubra]
MILKHNYLIWSSLFLSFVYLTTMRYPKINFRWLIKGTSILLLSLFSLFNCPPSISIILSISLVFSAFGDIFLAYNENKFFIHGLVSFLISHLIYSYIFYSNMDILYLKFILTKSNIIILILLILHSIIMIKILYPKLQNLKIPVLVYMTALMAMSVGTILSNYSNPYLITGALFFIASDSALAIQKFIKSFLGINSFIWITYYFAQIFILFSFLKV